MTKIIKKIIFLINFLILASTSFSAFFITDNSYIVKVGTPVVGTFYETITGSSGASTIESAVTPFSSYNFTVEMHTKFELFNNTFFGVGVSYLTSSGTVDARELTPADSTSKLVTEQTIGIDYIPIFIMLQYKFDSTFYPDEDMFFNFKIGLATEQINENWQNAAEDLGIQNIANSPSPFVSLGLGFEYNSFVFEADYQYNASAAFNLTNTAYGWLSYTNRINLNFGYRFNLGNSANSIYDDELYDDYDYEEF